MNMQSHIHIHGFQTCSTLFRFALFTIVATGTLIVAFLKLKYNYINVLLSPFFLFNSTSPSTSQTPGLLFFTCHCFTQILSLSLSHHHCCLHEYDFRLAQLVLDNQLGGSSPLEEDYPLSGSLPCLWFYV